MQFKTQAIIGRLWRRWLWLRFRLFDEQRLDQPTLEWVGGLPILVLPQVFNPHLFWTGEYLATTLGPELIPAGSKVLDMGTGSGVGSVFAARWASQVVAVDINPEAVRCTQLNVLLNRVAERVQVLQGDLFTPVTGMRFDVVMFNPPYLRGQPETRLEMAFWSPDIIPRFLRELPQYLEPGGQALVLISSIGDRAGFQAQATQNGLYLQQVSQRVLIGETLYIFRLRMRSVESEV